MKKNILNILEIVRSISEFDDCSYSLTINYKNIVNDFEYKKFDENTEQFFNDEIIEDVESFNFTLTTEENPPHREFHSTTIYFDSYWKTNRFTFYGGNDTRDPTEPVYDISKYCKVDLYSIGKRGEVRLTKEVTKPDCESDERWASITSNSVEYDRIGEVLDKLLQLDKLLDDTHHEKMKIIKSLNLK